MISTILAPTYEVRCTKDSSHALEFIASTEPDLILLDALMPGQDGWQVLGALKAEPALAAVPVIMLSALDERPLAFGLGAAGYVQKPIDRDALVGAVRRALAAPQAAAGVPAGA